MKTKAKDLGINLVESFSEFKDFKNIDRATMMRVLEDVFRNILKKRISCFRNCWLRLTFYLQ